MCYSHDETDAVAAVLCSSFPSVSIGDEHIGFDEREMINLEVAQNGEFNDIEEAQVERAIQARAQNVQAFSGFDCHYITHCTCFALARLLGMICCIRTLSSCLNLSVNL